MVQGQGKETTKREEEKLGHLGGKKAGPLRMGHSGCWRDRRGGAASTGGGAEVAEVGMHRLVPRAQ